VDLVVALGDVAHPLAVARLAVARLVELRLLLPEAGGLPFGDLRRADAGGLLGLESMDIRTDQPIKCAITRAIARATRIAIIAFTNGLPVAASSLNKLISDGKTLTIGLHSGTDTRDGAAIFWNTPEVDDFLVNSPG
jgi:hypothetical protein